LAAHPAASIGLVRHDNARATTITIVGELDVAAADGIGEELMQAADRFGVIVVDLRDLEFIDSAGIRLLIQLALRCRERRRRLVLLPGPAAVQRVFELAGVLGDFEFLAAPPPGELECPICEAPLRRSTDVCPTCGARLG
jgi:anti-anti-sigma factor